MIGSKNNVGAESQFASETRFEEIGFPWRMLIFSLFLFALSLLVFFGLRFGYKTYLEARLDSIDGQMDDLAANISGTEKDALIAFYSQLVNVETVLGRHRFASNILDFLEDNTLQSIYYDSADVSMSGLGLKVSGKADTLENLVAQLSVFDEAPNVARAILTNLSLDGPEIGFGADLVFKDDFFEKLQ